MKYWESLVASVTVCVGLLCISGATSITEENVVARLEEMQTFLDDGFAGLPADISTEQIDDIQREIDGLRAMQEQLKRQEKEIERLVALANAKQLEDLATRLTATLQKEILFRKLSEISPITHDQIEYVSKDDLRQQLDLENVLNESESQLMEWILRIAQDELEDYKNKILSSRVDQAPHVGGCPTITDIVRDVQVALTRFTQDGIGLIDHAQGAEVVYSMTSPTYEPTPSEYELLGSVWWRRYIPEDWERLLPEGWQNWSVNIPSYVYHSLVSRLLVAARENSHLILAMSHIFVPFPPQKKLKGAKTAPAETILEKKVMPGSCWPMDGSSGQVTLRLPYSIRVESFTIDHVSSRILPEYTLETAPRKMKVIAYPPCDHPEACGALGFDASDPMQVAQFEYDITGTMTQTFNSIFVSLPQASDQDDNGSCSTATAACTTPPKIDVAAVTLKVTDNYGSPDYTCIYRFRVHGEQII